MKKTTLKAAVAEIFGTTKTIERSKNCRQAILEVKGLTRTGKKGKGMLVYPGTSSTLAEEAMRNFRNISKNGSAKKDIAMTIIERKVGNL